ncbi:MAG: flippase, partial [Tenericutes bacterium]|nr:flippase [Mycoplasmatota bacterium]
MINNLKNKITHSLTMKNSIWMIIANIIQMIIALFINRTVAEYLDVENYGIINYGISFVAFFTSLCTLGFNSILIKELINNKNKNGKIIGTSVTLRLISSLISIILIYIIIFLLKENNKEIVFCALLQSLALFFDAFTIIGLWYQANLKSKYVAITGLVSYIVVAIYKLTLVYNKKSIYWFAFSNSLTSIVIGTILIFLYFKHKGQKFSFSLETGKNLLKNSYHFILSGLMIAIYAQIDKIMIGSILENISAVGLYSVATTIITLWSFVPNSIVTAFNPTIVFAKNESKEKYIRRLKQLYSIIIWLSIAYALFITIFSKQIIGILYGSKYLGATTALNISIWGVSFSFIGVVREIWLVNNNIQKYSKWFAILGALANIILNIFMIPTFVIVGAAIATFITQLLTGLIANLFFKETRVNFKYIIEAML